MSLRIEYTELELPFTSGNPLEPPLLNIPGVPSYTPLTGSSDNLFLSPNHSYKLAKPTGLPRWRAVALRGNHAYDEVLPARAMLKLLDKKSGGKTAWREFESAPEAAPPTP